MNHDKIVPQAFMLLPRDIRDHIAQVFDVNRSGITEIRDDTVILDGRTLEDLSVITSEKMAEYVGSVESFGRLWELSIAKAKHELYPPAMVIGKEAFTPAEVTKVTPKKNAKKAK